ncbi:Hypothetical protein PBC10988_27820 [Planctomycetales bacterium 10988]|nr:Hypothetical protein PBC10988_27820 [Planctomycetales bacterium 10988]
MRLLTNARLRPPQTGSSLAKRKPFQIGMFGLCLSMASLVCLKTTTALAETVSLDGTIKQDAMVYAGPGDRYYPVLKLSEGSKVQVVGRSEQGWLAILPPEGSFCWVPARAVDRHSPSEGTINTSQTAIRIGSLFHNQRAAIQSHLDQGAKIEILGETVLTTGEQTEPWLQIPPPEKEVRWIEMQDVEITSRPSPAILPTEEIEAATPLATVTTVPTETEQQPQPSEETPLPGKGQVIRIPSAAMKDAPIERDEEVVTADWQEMDSDEEAAEVERVGYQEPAPEEQPPTTEEDEETIPELKEKPSEPAESAASPAPAKTTFPADPRQKQFEQAFTKPAALKAESAEEQQRLLDRLESQLAETVTQPARNWELNPIIREAEALLHHTQTPEIRGRARILLRQLGRWQELQSEYIALAASSSGAVLPRTIPNTPNPSTENLPLLPADLVVEAIQPLDGQTPARYPGQPGSENGRYDGTGIVKSVHSLKVGAPRYALVDANGNIRVYVTPAPGVSMRHYLGRRVGVVGTTGVVPELQRQHVIAKHIKLLDSGGLRR